MRADISNVKAGMKLLCKEASSGFTEGYFYNVEGVNLEGGWVKMIGDCGGYRSVRSNLPKFDVVEYSTMITPDKLEQLVGFQGKSLVITESNTPHFPVGMTTKVYAKFNAYGSGTFYYINRDGDEAFAEEFIRNFSEGNISVEVVEVTEEKPVFKSGDKVVVRSSQHSTFWYAGRVGQVVTLGEQYDFNSWYVVEHPLGILKECDIELYVEPKKHDDFEDALKYVFGLFPKTECTKELLSVQEYLRQTGVVGLDVVISASQMLVVDEDGECYECDDISHVYSVVDAVALLGEARK